MGELRASLIWHDEVMDERVGLGEIAIGPSSKATFVTPELGLPEAYKIVRPGARGQLLTLAPGMRGTLCIDGALQDIAALVANGYYATPIAGKDWGVVELGATCKLFFQFVARDELPLAGAGFEPEARASLAFSVLLHAALLMTTYRLAEAASPFVYPGPRALTGSYLVTRIEQQPVMPTTASRATPGPAPTVMTVNTPLQPATAPHYGPTLPRGGGGGGGGGSAGGLLSEQGHAVIESLRGHRFSLGALATLGGETGGPPTQAPGPGTRGEHHGSTFGEHHGTDHAIDTGGMRKATLCVGDCGGASPVEFEITTTPKDDEPSLTKREIDDVVRAGSSRLRACYQRQLDRKSDLAGTITVRFVIDHGDVQSTAVAGDTVRDSEVVACVRRNIQMLKFPARGGAIVTYPFVFAPG